MAVLCPTASSSVAASGAGDARTICMHGELEGADTTGHEVYAKVYLAADGVVAVTYAQVVTYTKAIVAAGKWCARGVPVPALGAGGGSLPGAAVIARAWQVVPTTSTIAQDWPVSCNAVNTEVGGTDCCLLGPCAGGSGAGLFLAAPDLVAASKLRVTVPDGPNAGTHPAKAVAHLKWEVAVGKATYTLTAAGDGLALRGAGGAAGSTAVETGPFSATFPGHVVGASSEVVVTTA